jgi:ABC-type multidrug transport system ATPase subunit
MPVSRLSGGERARVMIARLMLAPADVLLLDEPTNDLDIDTLTVVEDFLDGWPGTLIVVTHDRYFLERVTDVTYALSGDGRCELLPGGIDQYLAARRDPTPTETSAGPGRAESERARQRRTGKELTRIENQLAKADARIDELHEAMAAVANDHVRLAELNTELNALLTRKDELEEAWLAAADE